MEKKTVVLGVSSGIAAYKCLELIDLLKKDGVEVFVMMTKSAALMVPPAEFEKASGNKVYAELFEEKFDYKKILKDRLVDHIALADLADVMVIAPATANTIAKIANGFADDFLTTTVLAATTPVIICPSMNVNMYNNPAVAENISRLQIRGFQILGPAEGMLVCGYEGKGRLEDVKIIKDEIMRQLNRTQSLKGRKIIVTAGGTTEKIDDVRSITNKSSGKMGSAIAEECFLRGAEVLLLRAKNSAKPRYMISEELFENAQELEELIKKYAAKNDILFHTAAVSDFKALTNFKGKVSGKKPLNLKLAPRQKIVSIIKKLNPQIKLIAFKAEYGLSDNELIKTAKQKLKEYRADAVVANDVSKSDRGFEADTNEVHVILENKYKKIPLNSKRNIASGLIDFLIKSEVLK